MKTERVSGSSRGVAPVIGIILVVAITVILSSVAGVYALGLTDVISDAPAFTALELDFEQEGTGEYGDMHWKIDVTHTGGDNVDGEDILIHLDHGDQRLTGGLNGTITAGETVRLNVIHNQNDDIDDLDCGNINVACRLAGDPGNYPEENKIQLRMIHEPSNTILKEEEIEISELNGIYNGGAGPDIADETFTFA